MGNCVKTQRSDSNSTRDSPTLNTRSAHVKRVGIPPYLKKGMSLVVPIETDDRDVPFTTHSAPSHPNTRHSFFRKSENLAKHGVGISASPQETYCVHLDGYLRLILLFEELKSSPLTRLNLRKLPKEVLGRYAGNLELAWLESLPSEAGENTWHVSGALIQPGKVQLLIPDNTRAVIGVKQRQKYKAVPAGKTFGIQKDMEVLVVCSLDVSLQIEDEELVTMAGTFHGQCDLAARHIVSVAQKRWLRSGQTTQRSLSVFVVWLST